MGIINQYPEGFLDLLKAKVGGRPPTSLADTVVPTLELNAFYFTRFMSQENFSLTSTFLAFGSLEVPENEIWVLFSAGVKYTTAAANQTVWIDLELLHLPLAGSTVPAPIWTTQPKNPDVYALPAAISIVRDVITFPQPIYLAPGVEIMAKVVMSNSPSRNLVVDLGVYKFIA